MLPGIPTFPFLSLALLTGGAAFLLTRRQKKEEVVQVQEQKKKEAAAPVLEEPISTALTIDAIRLELGYGLLGLINTERGHRLTDQI